MRDHGILDSGVTCTTPQAPLARATSHHYGVGGWSQGFIVFCAAAIIQQNIAVATPTGFEPVISALTGQCVRPLHHGAAFSTH